MTGPRPGLASGGALDQSSIWGGISGEVSVFLFRLGADPGIRQLPGDPIEVTTEALRAGKAGAVFVGRMEYGPRALGARSIIASPSDAGVNDRLNDRLDRSEFMPFAPCVLEEDCERVFEITKVNRYAARFMTITCAVRRESARSAHSGRRAH